MTQPALKDLSIEEAIVEKSQETYDELGVIDIYIYNPPPPEPFTASTPTKFPQIFIETLRNEVSQEYSIVARSPEKGFHFHTGQKLAELLDYQPELLEGFTDQVIESFAGTGNIFKLGEIQPGEKVVDVGSGAGLDSLIAARLVGSQAEVIGVDMTPTMLEKARLNASTSGIDNVRFVQGYSEDLPVSDEWADVVITNGAINLSPDKDSVFAELFRVLKSGGCLQIADILVSKSIPDGAKNNIDL